MKLNYVVEGEGPWVTLSHAVGCNLSMWDEQAALLVREGFRVLRFDTRGHGGSEAPAGRYTLDELADDVHALLAELGIARTHWVGLSLGGMIGETYALRYPGVFTRMVLADTSARLPPGADRLWAERARTALEEGMAALVDATLARWFTEGFRAARPEVMARIAAAIRSTPAAGYAGCCHAIGQLDLLDRLHDIRCPVSVVVGEQDPATPPAMSRQIQEAIDGAELVVIPDAAHIANIEQPAAFNAALLDFLRR
jgi:3-oxoadipate enol-lactonase